MKSLSWRPPVIATLWGALAGGIVAVVFTLMTSVQHLIWPDDIARWQIPIIICAGAALIALLRPHTDDQHLDAQIKATSDPFTLRRRRTAALALSAIVAYGFGGAIGPEAGLIAVTAELSALVAARIAQSEFEAQLIGQSGAAAALAGIYGSPPGAAAYDEDSLAPSKVYSFLAACSGFLTFLVVQRAIGHDHASLGIPSYHHSSLQLLAAVIPGVLGAAIGLLYRYLEHLIAGLLGVVTSSVRQTLIGSAAFAVLATIFPIGLFSGHDQLADLPGHTGGSALALLAGSAVVKILALAIVINSGWRGGEFFPLLFAGAAIGAAAAAIVPGLDIATAEVAGLAAATATGLKKPIAAALICALLIGEPAWGPLMVGAMISTLLLRVTAAQNATEH